MGSHLKIMHLLILTALVTSCSKDNWEDPPPDVVQSQFPFPHHTSYTGSHIKPDNYSQSELDDQTGTFYSSWKREYVRNDCKNDEYFICSGDGAKTISEAHGYGMMIMCFMAGYEKSAKAYFDGLFRYYKSHPSLINNHLMDWQQITCDDSPGSDDDAASDGDVDIAFSLLLAHEQWGSDGEIDYLAEARTIINAIMEDEINPYTRTVKLGDWSNSSDPGYYYGTRSSDFITSHFRVFCDATGNSDWNLVIDECYSLVSIMQSAHSTVSGLMPDFIVNTNTTPVPAGPDYLEDIYDGDYYYNACRFPWRIGTDYLLTGDSRAKAAINKINSWLISSTSGNISAISNGYRLNGSPVYDWNDATFTGPLTVGAMADISNQGWLNKMYEEVVTNNDLRDGDYYSNTIKLLSLITISGNYWNPDL
jgi:endo-1,4-beta-D-glucanase Y